MHGFMSRFRPFFLSAAVFSLVMNMLMLAPALFMLQVFDRVLTSLSIETLVMLLLLVVVALLCMSFLDMIRQRFGRAS
jgi:ABC-type protease/lipase transport system fused ATPase/permease subunit